MIASWMEVAANVLMIISLPPVLLFILDYLRGAWRESLVGRSLMFQAVALAMVIFVMVLGIFVANDYPLRHVIRLIGFAALAISTWQMLITLRIQRGIDAKASESRDGSPEKALDSPS